LKVNDTDIVEFLRKRSGWVTAETIARQFGVSPRTIRNHIQSINTADLAVLSGPLGYKAKMLLHGWKEKVDDQESDIGQKLLYELLDSHGSSLSLDEFLANHYLSESSARDIIRDFNRDHSADNVQVVEKKRQLRLIGDESDKRRLFKSFLHSNRSASVPEVNIQRIQRLIPDIPLLDMEKIVNETVNQDSLTINQYQLFDLLMHYAISVNRIQNGKAMHRLSATHEELTGRNEYKLTLRITAQLEKRYYIKFSKAEIDGLTLALIGKTIIKNFSSMHLGNLSRFVPERVIEETQRALEKADEEYGFNLQNPSFSVKFIIHVNNARDRATYHDLDQQDVNQFSLLKQEYPLYYDLALYIGKQLQNSLHLTMNSQELTYIILHLGAYLNTDDIDRINTVLISPSYYDIGNELKTNISREFRQDIQISAVYNALQVEELKKLRSKLVVATIDTSIPIDKSNYVVRIHPFMTSQDHEKIERTISVIRRANRVDEIVGYFKQYTSADNFLIDPQISKRDALFSRVTKLLTERGFVSPQYYDELSEREQLSPTSFGNIAIPHPLNMKANKTGIFVVIDHDGIQWHSSTKVNIACFIATSKANQKVFSIVLQNLINILSVKENVDQILKVDNYEDFLSVLIQILKGGYDTNV
jgi:lichenan operon transcriptional antiterminator